MKYANVSSVLIPIPHSTDIPVPDRFSESSSSDSFMIENSEGGRSTEEIFLDLVFYNEID